MDHSFKASKVTENVYWVGAIDWDIRNFHGYLTSRGTTYNAFLVLGEKVTLIDTVKAPFRDEMFARISSVIDPGKIDYIVSNHSEMDHSGSLPQTIHIVKPEKVFASKMGQRALTNHFHMDQEITVVGDGDSVDLGGLRLSFVETRMCHWPDSMVSYLHEDELLFSQDAFGMHLASYERFADELDCNVLEYEAGKYFANILLHLSSVIEKTLKKVGGLGLNFSIIAPDHGPIWRRQEDIAGILDSYARWARQEPTNKAVVIYDTMWQSTASMARAIGEGLSAGGATVRMLSMNSAHRSNVITELLEAGAILVGSPTINNGLFPTIADVMCYIKGLKPRNLVGAAFGSFGWSGEAARQLHQMLEDIGAATVAGPLRINYVPDDEALAQCRQLGLTVAQANRAQLAGDEIPQLGETKPIKPVPAAKQCKININDSQKELTVKTGESVFKTLQDQSILLPTICGGQGLCGYCKIEVLQGGTEITPAERQQLTHSQLENNLRLACQVIVREDMKITIPEESLGSQQFRGVVQDIEDLNHDVKRLRIRLTQPGQIDFLPGQHIKLNVPKNIDPAGISRAYSFANSPSDNSSVELIIRRVPGGICTNWIFQQLQAGDKVSFSGPFGDFRLSDCGCEMVWIAGGSGMSPFWSMLQYMKENNIARKCTFFFGAVGQQDLFLVDQLRQLEKELAWLTYIPALSAPAEADDWAGQTGLITEVLARNTDDVAELEAYLCGSPGMIAAAVNTLREKGVAEESIFFDKHT